ncbi:flagellar basal body rod protein FlgC [Cryptosporangium aurantiacum]|uniref:Flagellar basal-body rod protein FlgC n=1 Tax=Cryptosporangium aurantiacum TaxID=134849 RepID=A0A1M7R783_9ACTN|nr:flagellar basal body rod C-terminal domain-containing protein [Cryptosporangium aurantiacum]SHN42011.1 flagellar basal-body rod protein FlgC [Cryptosporangium aurantiacum]
MTLFPAIGISSTGVTVHRKWLDAISDNLANINDARPTSGEAYREKQVVAQAVDYGDGTGGVQVGGIVQGNPEGRLVYAPDNALADAEGYVRMPDIDLADQMGQLLMAQRGYQSNLAVIDRARDSYQAAIQLGKA